MGKNKAFILFQEQNTNFSVSRRMVRNLCFMSIHKKIKFGRVKNENKAHVILLSLQHEIAS
jgi:hypothetical protein